MSPLAALPFDAGLESYSDIKFADYVYGTSFEVEDERLCVYSAKDVTTFRIKDFSVLLPFKLSQNGLRPGRTLSDIGISD